MNPYIQIRTFERSYLKVTRSTLSRIIYDMSGQSLIIKMLATIVNNIRVTNNHIDFGINRLVKYFSAYCEESVTKAFEKLKNMNYFKEISKSELIFNPAYISFGSSDNYDNIREEYLSVLYDKTKSKGKGIKAIGDITSIPVFDNSNWNKKGIDKNAIFDYHFGKVKDAFIESLGELPHKKMKVLSMILLATKENDRNIIISELKIPANKETVSNVVKYLRGKEILINSIRGAYNINSKYISSSTPYKRKKHIEKIEAQIRNNCL